MMGPCELKVCNRSDGGRDGGSLVPGNLIAATGAEHTDTAGVRFQSGRVSLVIKSVRLGRRWQNLPRVPTSL